MQAALAGNLSADFLLNHRLDSNRLFAALKAVPTGGRPPLPAADQPLLDDALRAAARCLTVVANVLPGFEIARVQHTLDLFDALRADVGLALDEVRAIRERVDRLSGSPADEYEADYRLAVAEGLDRVELFGADLPDEVRRVRLEHAHITLMLTDEADESDDARRLTTEAVFADLLPQSGRLLVRGPAGGGKTTLVRWAAIQAARMAPAAQPEYEVGPDGVRIRPNAERDRLAATAARDWRQRVPFVVSLRDRPGGDLPAPHEFPAAVSRNLATPPADWVRRTLRAGRGLVLIDGVDEVPAFSRRKLQAGVSALVAAFPNSYFVLTTRPEAVPPDWLAADEFREVGVDALSPEARDALIRRWFEAVARGRRAAGGAADDWQADADGLIAALGQTPGVAALVNNPLLCAMACALYRLRRATLPADLPAMCETLTELMLHRRDQERRVQLDQYAPYPRLSYRQKKAAVGRVAFHMVLNERSTLPVPDAVEQVGKALAQLPDFAAEDAGSVFRGLLERGGLWREAAPAADGQPATIEFLHNTFKEFLAGEQMADEGNAGVLLLRLNDAGWRQVGLFAVAAGSHRFQNQFLDGLLARIPDPLPKVTQRGPDDQAVRQLAFYAYQCRGQATRCDEPTKARLNALAAQLVPPRNFTDAACLAAGGNAAVPLLGYRSRPAAHQAACVRALKLIGTPEAAEALRAYWADDRQTVGDELRGTADPWEVMGDEIVRRLEAGEELPWWVVRSMTHLRPLAGNSRIQFLDLWPSLADDLSPLAGMVGLQTLRLGYTRGRSLEPLAGLAGLRELDIHYTRGDDLSPLGRLSGLEVLSLRGHDVTDLTPISTCVALRRLNVFGAQVHDLRPLAALARLTELNLSHTLVTDLSPLHGLDRLQRLTLDDTPLADASSLAGLTTLHTLGLAGTRVVNVSPLAGLVNLVRLDLSATAVADVAPLAGLVNLRTLDLRGAPVTDLSPLNGLTG